METELQKILIGENAFYNKKNYQTALKEEIEKIKPPAPIYTYGHKNNFLIRLLKVVLPIIIFPVGLYLLIHIIIGRIILQASSYSFLRNKEWRKNLAKSLEYNNGNNFSDFKIKRITFQVNGKKIDAVIIGKKETFNNGRWTIEHMGNASFYENYLEGHDFIQKFLNKTKSNLILFNNPGVGCSEGPFTRRFAKNVYQSIVKFVEEKIGAKEIIHRSISLGGMLQADALKGYNFKDKVKHICIKMQTAKSMGMAVYSICDGFILIASIAKLFIRLFGWNIDVVTASKKLKCKEIVIQSATRNMDGSMKEVFHDRMFSKESSLAHTLRKEKCEGDKYFIPTHENHFDWASDIKAREKFFEVMDKILLKKAFEIKEAV